MDFRKITEPETRLAYAVYFEVFEWLNAKGVRQWLRAVPEETFRQRQARGELFALWIGERIAGIVTLALEEDADWLKYLSQEKRWWIKSLAIARDYSGKKLGERMVRECEAHIARTDGIEVWLECVDVGFLPHYYTKLGFEVIKRADITYPSGNTFPVTLMRKALR